VTKIKIVGMGTSGFRDSWDSSIKTPSLSENKLKRPSSCTERTSGSLKLKRAYIYSKEIPISYAKDTFLVILCMIR
jgi:hypothetical protein